MACSTQVWAEPSLLQLGLPASSHEPAPQPSPCLDGSVLRPSDYTLPLLPVDREAPSCLACSLDYTWLLRLLPLLLAVSVRTLLSPVFSLRTDSRSFFTEWIPSVVQKFLFILVFETGSSRVAQDSLTPF